jgi:hypothetical protein
MNSNSNPYAPPKALVTDSQSEAEAIHQQPAAVRVAVWLLWVSLAVAVVSSAVRIKGSTEQAALNYALGLLISNAVLSIWLNLKIAAGRNWARIVWMVWFLLGASLTAAMFLTVLKQYTWNPLARVQGLLQIVIFVLLLTPSAARWFKRKRNSDTAVTLQP